MNNFFDCFQDIYFFIIFSKNSLHIYIIIVFLLKDMIILYILVLLLIFQ